MPTIPQGHAAEKCYVLCIYQKDFTYIAELLLHQDIHQDFKDFKYIAELLLVVE